MALPIADTWRLVIDLVDITFRRKGPEGVYGAAVAIPDCYRIRKEETGTAADPSVTVYRTAFHVWAMNVPGGAAERPVDGDKILHDSNIYTIISVREECRGLRFRYECREDQ